MPIFEQKVGDEMRQVEHEGLYLCRRCGSGTAGRQKQQLCSAKNPKSRRNT